MAYGMDKRPGGLVPYVRSDTPGINPIQPTRSSGDPTVDDAEAIFAMMFEDEDSGDLTPEDLEDIHQDRQTAKTAVQNDIVSMDTDLAVKNAKKEGILIGAAAVVGIGIVYLLFT